MWPFRRKPQPKPETPAPVPAPLVVDTRLLRRPAPPPKPIDWRDCDNPEFEGLRGSVNGVTVEPEEPATDPALEGLDIPKDWIPLDQYRQRRAQHRPSGHEYAQFCRQLAESNTPPQAVQHPFKGDK